MSKQIVIPYKPRPLQKDFHTNIKRWNILVCHRRFGKTVMVVNQLIKDALTTKKDRPRFAYIAPTYKQAKQIAWDYLKYFSRPIPGTLINESELRIDYPNGARIQIHGADNPDALRGIYLDGVAIDEYAQIRPSLFSEVIRPALSDRKGYAIFIGTPKGKNHFYDLFKASDDKWYSRVHKASETGIMDAEEMVDAQKVMTPDEYLQEYECSWQAAIKGSYYSDELKTAREEGRISRGLYDPLLPVNTYWDIGFRDDTAIIFAQFLGKEIRIIDAYNNSGLTITDYIGVIREKPYKYKEHWFPHDAFNKSVATGKSVAEIAVSYDLDVRAAPNLSLNDGINQGRMRMRNCWIEEPKCGELLEALLQYRREWDEKKQDFRANPLHDWSSHYADAWRYMAISYEPPNFNEDSDEPESELPYDPEELY